MNRFHVHLNVSDLAASTRFYTELFATPPSVQKADYAKWMLEDPRVNFAISTRGSKIGVDHLGIQTETEEELGELRARAVAAGMTLLDEGETSCCYARSDKYWLQDPQGLAWEGFRTLADVPLYGETPKVEQAKSACCVGGQRAETESSKACC